jgi:hypothetical protein
MAIAQLSPGVVVNEVDLTTVVPSVLTTAGAYVGPFAWGPVNSIVPISTEPGMVATFGKPNTFNANSWFTAASFLAYGNNLNLVRAANTSTNNATSVTNTTGSANVQIQNASAFQFNYLGAGAANTYGPFVARYPGVLGNSITVSVIDGGANTIQFTDWQVPVSNVAGYNYANVALSGFFGTQPGTSYSASQLGAANDEIHIAVVDTGGLITGTQGTVLETFPFLSKAIDGIDKNGNSNYYKNVLFTNSAYVYAMDPVNYSATNATWGRATANTSFATLSGAQTISLAGGTEIYPTDADIVNAYDLFSDPVSSQVSLLMTGPWDTTVQQNAIQIASSRKDCVAFVSPPQSAVVNNAGNEQTSVTAWYNGLSSVTGNPSGSYGFADSGWKYMFDKYNNAYRWVPLNGDIAGLCVSTDSTNAPWWSPAGFNRGAIKNVIKLAWNPTQAQRNAIYPYGINPVASFPGNGTVLFGDKTMQVKPSAFDRINVRRLFIVLEQAIQKAAQYSLFEFNDAFTQAQFVALVTPFLAQVQGQRGITAFQVVCDSTNNTPAVIDANQFVGDIYIQPARSINYIQLNFTAVGTGVNFSTVVGQA